MVSPRGYAAWPELSSHLGDDVVLTKKENKGRQGIREVNVTAEIVNVVVSDILNLSCLWSICGGAGDVE